MKRFINWILIKLKIKKPFTKEELKQLICFSKFMQTHIRSDSNKSFNDLIKEVINQ